MLQTYVCTRFGYSFFLPSSLKWGLATSYSSATATNWALLLPAERLLSKKQIQNRRCILHVHGKRRKGSCDRSVTSTSDSRSPLPHMTRHRCCLDWFPLSRTSEKSSPGFSGHLLEGGRLSSRANAPSGRVKGKSWLSEMKPLLPEQKRPPMNWVKAP